MQNEEKDNFICPECGSLQASIVEMVSTNYNPRDPWSAVLERITCAKCDYVIPAHLAKRWDKISVEEARQEWQDKYRATAWHSSDPDEE